MYELPEHMQDDPFEFEKNQSFKKKGFKPYYCLVFGVTLPTDWDVYIRCAIYVCQHFAKKWMFHNSKWFSAKISLVFALNALQHYVVYLYREKFMVYIMSHDGIFWVVCKEM